MDHGEVVEQGRHDVLLARRARYARLYDQQFKPRERVSLSVEGHEGDELASFVARGPEGTVAAGGD